MWGGVGMAIIIFLAGLTNIPAHLYEAAKIDGADAFQMFRWITLPLLMPTITFVMVTGFMGASNVLGSVFVLTGGGPLNATRVLAFHIYETALIRLKMGEASGVAFILFVIVMALTRISTPLPRLSILWSRLISDGDILLVSLEHFVHHIADLSQAQLGHGQWIQLDSAIDALAILLHVAPHNQLLYCQIAAV